MRIAVTGASGGLGGRVVAMCAAYYPSWECIGLARKDADLLNPATVEPAIISCRPDVVVHCAAMTAVDVCEEEQSLAMAINVEGTRVVASVAKKAGAKFVYISTDYIFDGKKETPYTEDDPPNPISVYGKTKMLGEGIAAEVLGSLIVRTSWLYGSAGKSFVSTILRLASTQKELRIVNDQVGAPTCSADLALAILRLLEKDASGIYHVTNSGYCSWFDFAREIIAMWKMDGVTVIPITSLELGRPAKRPLNSRLDCSRYENVTGERMREWRTALADVLCGAAG